jgi:hypothetical protein
MIHAMLPPDQDPIPEFLKALDGVLSLPMDPTKKSEFHDSLISLGLNAIAIAGRPGSHDHLDRLWHGLRIAFDLDTKSDNPAGSISDLYNRINNP